MLIVKIKNLYKRCFFDRIVILNQKFSYKYWQNIYFLFQSVNQQIRKHIFILSFIKQWNRILLENGFFFIIPILPLSANRARSTARYFWYAVPAIVNGILERVKEYRREIVDEIKLEKKVEIISKGEFPIVGWHLLHHSIVRSYNLPLITPTWFRHSAIKIGHHNWRADNILKVRDGVTKLWPRE